MGKEQLIHAAVWRCYYCGKESIHIGTDAGSSGTRCPTGCLGRFVIVKRYPLATGLDGIKDAFSEIEGKIIC